MVKLNRFDELIVYQLEYFFGNKNLQKDLFMQKMLDSAIDDEGWISSSILAQFQNLSSLRCNWKEIIEVFERLPIKFVEISEDRQKIRRHPKNKFTFPKLIVDTKGQLKELVCQDPVIEVKEDNAEDCIQDSSGDDNIRKN
jgi:hypothetical protein